MGEDDFNGSEKPIDNGSRYSDGDGKGKKEEPCYDMGFFAMESKVRVMIQELLEPTKLRLQEAEKDSRNKSTLIEKV